MIKIKKYFRKSAKKHWKPWIKQDLRRIFYRFFYGWRLGGNGTMMPATGKGKYVSVYSKGCITQIVNEEKEEEIRIVPCQYNHGVMVEYWEERTMRWRQHLGLDQLKKDIVYASNIEQLTNRKND